MQLPSILKKIFNKRFLIVIIVITILGFLGWLIFPKQKTEAIQFTSVKKRNIASTVTASGVLSGKETSALKFKISGKLAYINVKEGDLVKKGQTIAGLDTQDLDIALQQAYNTLRSKQAIAEKILDDVKDHSKDETFTQKQTRTQAEADRDSAFDAVKAAQRAFQDAILTSPIEGIVTQVGPVPGQVVSSADVIAQISDNKDLYFDVDIDEADIGKVLPNQKAEVNLDAYSDKVFEGVVEKIVPQTKTTSSGATTVSVRISLEGSDIRFVAGLNGQASIILSSAKDVLIIPQETLREDGTVLVKDGKGFKPVKVITGIKSETDVEVKTGLNENDQIVTNPSSVKGV